MNLSKSLSLLILSLILLSACASNAPENDSTDSQNTNPVQQEGNESHATLEPGNFTDLPLSIPEDMRLDYFVEDLSGARVIAGPDAEGNFWVSRTRQGIISRLEVGEDGEVAHVEDVLKNLSQPHGLALDPQDPSILYYAEVNKVSRITIDAESPPEKLVDLPAGGRHFTRTLLFGPDDRLYISIGSSCDVCEEKDERLATVYSMNRDGSDLKLYSEGLRNAVFMTINPITGDLWATEMGRDQLGDDLPPDEVNILRDGGHYGWPYCYGKNVKDETFKSEEGCEDKIPSHLDLQAHSAPLDLTFVPEEGWPEEYWHDLLIAYHGSWNRSEPTGYSIMRIELDDEGNEVSRSPFIQGWLDENEKPLGRPVDLKIFPGGLMYITDDHKGVVYRLRLTKEPY